MKINLASALKSPLAQRLGLAGSVATTLTVAQIQQSGRLPTLPQAGVIAGVSLGSMIPAGRLPSGILTPKSADQPSVLQSLIGLATAKNASARAQAKQDLASEAADIAFQKVLEKIGGETLLGGITADQLAAAHDAISQTGGNQ
jgi:hypothetical protein